MKLVCDNLTYYRRRNQEQKLNFFAVLENLEHAVSKGLTVTAITIATNLEMGSDRFR